jgi:hypothetical protein
MICEFNGAKDAGEARFDPRYDCDADAVWHILLAVDARSLAMRGVDRVFACEEHASNVHHSTAMLHRIDPQTCGRPETRWRLGRNTCE